MREQMDGLMGGKIERKLHLGPLDTMLGAAARFELSTATCKSTTPTKGPQYAYPLMTTTI